jgi:hypothetical protein
MMLSVWPVTRINVTSGDTLNETTIEDNRIDRCQLDHDITKDSHISARGHSTSLEERTLTLMLITNKCMTMDLVAI